MAEADTPTQGETKTEVTSNNAGVPAQGAGTDSQAAELAARLAEAEKKAQQAEMRARQLENERQEAERKQMEEDGKYKELLERADKQLAEIQQQREMDDLMSQYDPEVQKVAKKLFGAGDLSSQLAAIQEAVKQVADKKAEAGEPEAGAEQPQPPVQPMNPNPGVAGQHQSMFKPEMSLDEMADALDKKLKGQGL